MRNPGGVLISQGPIGTVEVDTFTCGHCNAVVPVPPKAAPGGYCTLCSKLICDRCVAAGTCRPFEKWLDRVEARRSYGL